VVVSICCVGAIFHDSAMFGAANWSSDCIRILTSEKSLGNQTLPHISQVFAHASSPSISSCTSPRTVIGSSKFSSASGYISVAGTTAPRLSPTIFSKARAASWLVVNLRYLPKVGSIMTSSMFQVIAPSLMTFRRFAFADSSIFHYADGRSLANEFHRYQP
jgi:hypothetical protein